MSPFSQGSDAALLWPLCQKGQLKTFSSGETLWEQGAPATHLYSVKQGLIEVSQWTSPGKETTLGLFSLGDVMALPPVLKNASYPASARAITGSADVWIVPATDFHDALKQKPELEPVVRDVLVRHMNLFQAKIQALSVGKVEQRLAFLFSHLASRFGRSESDGTVVPFRLTREQISRIVNVRLETVIRILSRWNKTGIVLSRPDDFLVPNIGALTTVLQQE